MKREIAKGLVVRYQDGNYRVTAVKGGKVNLGAIFGKAIYHKGVPIEQVTDDEAAWYKRWTQSETYMCM
jgi:ribosomal protein L11